MNIVSLVKNLGANSVFIPSEVNNIDFFEVIAGDFMADLLLSQKENPLLVTGLATEQSLRTAEMLGCVGVLLVNEKLPSIEMKTLAQELNIPLFATAFPLFEACVELNKLLERGV